MSTSNPQPATNPPAAAPAPAPEPKATPSQRREVRIVSHCMLFYWWPVWAVGFVMFLITMFTGEFMVTVPPKTVIEKPKEGDLGSFHYDFVVPGKKVRDKKETQPPLPEEPGQPGVPMKPHLWMSASKNLGVVFVVILLLVVVITNVPFRGLWSALVIGTVVSLSILFAWLDWWDTILIYLSWLDIRINAAGYLVISSTLFVLWLFVFLLFDRQIYIVFRPGTMIVRLEIGGAETVLDTVGMSVEKQRSDFFRHWILGFFTAGDLIVKPANKAEFHFPNVLMISSRVKRIEDTLQIKEVESAGRPH
jgi:hypothetical protein